ncbi:MAG: class I SAM-dependent DNA methyltransferase [Chthonomonadales bacterium]
MSDPTSSCMPPQPPQHEATPPADPIPFTLVASIYDELMRDIPYKSWVEHVRQIWQTMGLAPVRILDLACGTGNATLLFAAMGLQAVGVDLSPQMISRARRKARRAGFSIRYYVQNAASLQLREDPFDVCVSLFDSLNYVLSPDQLAEVFRRVFGCLKPGGLFVFDMNSPFALENGFFDQDNLATSDRVRYVWRSSYDGARRLCTVQMRFFVRERGVDREFVEWHTQRAYTQQEIEALLASAGFVEIACTHGYTFMPVRFTTDRYLFVARRPQ